MVGPIAACKTDGGKYDNREHSTKMNDSSYIQYFQILLSELRIYSTKPELAIVGTVVRLTKMVLVRLILF